VHEVLIASGLGDMVGEVNQELREAALGSSIVAQHRGEGSIA